MNALTAPRHAGTSGFTLLELTISMAILVVVSLLSMVVIQSTTSAAAVAEAKEQAQASVRDAMTAMAAELTLASKKENDALVPPLHALAVLSPTEIRFQVPANSNGTTWSTPITYRFANEDTGGSQPGNARLDSGEDLNGDGALTRHIVRVQGATERVLGAANDISAVVFQLNPPANNTLTITLTATKAVDNRRHDLVTATATSRVYLVN